MQLQWLCVLVLIVALIVHRLVSAQMRAHTYSNIFITGSSADMELPFELRLAEEYEKKTHWKKNDRGNNNSNNNNTKWPFGVINQLITQFENTRKNICNHLRPVFLFLKQQRKHKRQSSSKNVQLINQYSFFFVYVLYVSLSLFFVCLVVNTIKLMHICTRCKSISETTTKNKSFAHFLIHYFVE